jgi:hypothetical protein
MKTIKLYLFFFIASILVTSYIVADRSSFPVLSYTLSSVPEKPIIKEEINIDYKVVLPELTTGEQDVINRIKANKDIYSADPTCDWRIIGAIHFRETNLGTNNSWNGQGAFQNLGNRYTPNSPVTDWEAQVTQTCRHLKNKVGATQLTDVPLDTIGTALARYNGCMGKVWTECGYTAYKMSNEHMLFYKCSVDFSCHPLVPDYRLGTIRIYKELDKN